MKKAKIYIPNKSPMQSGLGKTDKWLLEFEVVEENKRKIVKKSYSDNFTE